MKKYNTNDIKIKVGSFIPIKRADLFEIIMCSNNKETFSCDLHEFFLRQTPVETKNNQKNFKEIKK